MVETIGLQVRQSIKQISYAAGFQLFLFRETFNFLSRRRIGLKVLIMQILFTGVEALSIISLLSLGIGAVIIIQGAKLPDFLLGDQLYRILIIVITRELGPLLTAFVIIARSGSAITTELGNMVVSHEMEAYLSVGIHPVSQLGVPRLIGVSLSMVLLTMYSNVFGLLGSLTVSSIISGVRLTDQLAALFSNFHMVDIIASVAKSFIFGLIIAATSVYYGFSVNGAVTEVPVKTIRSIGMSIVLCIIADGIIILITVLLGASNL
ncbi:MAG: ABC transporter permease [Spirochaetes bacterium]|nr:MAG: ABC transporter permease [Spirochaetota bacterium]